VTSTYYSSRAKSLGSEYLRSKVKNGRFQISIILSSVLEILLDYLLVLADIIATWLLSAIPAL
jgi:hypothetical protein